MTAPDKGDIRSGVVSAVFCVVVGVFGFWAVLTQELTADVRDVALVISSVLLALGVVVGVITAVQARRPAPRHMCPKQERPAESLVLVIDDEEGGL